MKEHDEKASWDELQDELRTSPIVHAVYKKQAAMHDGFVVSRECLIDMVRHLVRRVKELEDEAVKRAITNGYIYMLKP